MTNVKTRRPMTAKERKIRLYKHRAKLLARLSVYAVAILGFIFVCVYALVQYTTNSEPISENTRVTAEYNKRLNERIENIKNEGVEITDSIYNSIRESVEKEMQYYETE